MKALIAIVAAIVLAIGAFFILQDDAQPDPVAHELQPIALPEPVFAMVDDARIQGALENEPGSWLTYGMDFTERRFSSLTQINRDNVQDLGLAWHKDLGTFHAQEATPLVVDGLIIYPTAWNIVYAVDAVTGETQWVFDPKVDRHRCGGKTIDGTSSLVTPIRRTPEPRARPCHLEVETLKTNS